MSKFSKILVSIIIIYSLYILYIDIPTGNIYELLITMSVIPIVFVPKILRKLSIKISKMSENIYITFIFLAHFLGSIVDLYNNIWWYDTFTHFLSGIICSFFILEWLKNRGKYDPNDPIFTIAFIMGISFMIAGLWEDFEFITDKIFGADAQKVLTTGVDDTMKDMIVATLGALIFCINFYFRKDKKNSFISQFVDNI